MSDARWVEVESDIESAVEHFRRAGEIFALGGFADPGLDGYQATMAFQHAMQSGHTALEAALLRIFEICGEEAPAKVEDWHSKVVERAAREIAGGRPAILSAETAAAADETRAFRHVAMHSYNNFAAEKARPAVAAATRLAATLQHDILRFRALMDPH